MFDRDHYLSEVLPGLLDRSETKDLVLRYDLSDDENVPEPARLDQVAELWRAHPLAAEDKTLRHYTSQHAQIVSETEAAGAKFWKSRWKQHASGPRGTSPPEVLRSLVGEARKASRFIPDDQIERWVAACDGKVDADQIRAVAAQAGLEVCDPVALPVGSGLVGDDVRTMAEALEALGVATVLEVLFPGADLEPLVLRADLDEGPRLRWPMAPAAPVGTVACAGGSSGGPEVLATALAHWAGLPADAPDASAARAVLTILERLRSERGDDGIDELVWCQAVGWGRAKLRTVLSDQATLATMLGALPLSAESAELLAYSLAQARSGGSTELADVRAALDDGDVRLADRRLAPFLGPQATAEVTELRVDIQARLTRHLTLLDQADALVSTDPERAGLLLDEARAVIRDDPQAADRLARIAAPEVPQVKATVGADGVTVSWDPPPVRYGILTYRVVRGDQAVSVEDPAAVVVATATTDLQLVDNPPPGHAVRYGVIVQREGGRASPIVATPTPVTAFREVGDVEARVKGTEVHLSWSWPMGAKAVRVTRSSPGVEPVELPGASADGLVDATTALGFEYRYLISVCFDDHGEPAWSPGERVTIDVVPLPSPVGDLAVELTEEGYLLTWRRPALGEVGIRRLPVPPAAALGEEIASGDLKDYGTRLEGATLRDRDHQQLLDRPPAGRWWYLPVTINGSLCVAGTSVAVAFVEPVGSLTAKRRGGKVHVAWSWPQGSTDAHVEVRTGGALLRAIDLTEADYRRENGVWCDVGPAPVEVTVVVATALDSGRQRSAPVTTAVPGASLTVRQRLKRRPLSPPTLELSTADPSFVPPLVVRYVEGTLGPVDRRDGVELLRVDGFALPANGVHRVALRGLPPHTSVTCFPEDPSMDEHVRFVSATAR